MAAPATRKSSPADESCATARVHDVFAKRSRTSSQSGRRGLRKLDGLYVTFLRNRAKERAVTDAPHEFSRDDIELYVAGALVPAAGTTYSNGTLSHAPRRLAVGTTSVRDVATDGADNAAQRSWAFRVR